MARARTGENHLEIAENPRKPMSFRLFFIDFHGFFMDFPTAAPPFERPSPLTPPHHASLQAAGELRRATCEHLAGSRGAALQLEADDVLAGRAGVEAGATDRHHRAAGLWCERTKSLYSVYIG